MGRYLVDQSLEGFWQAKKINDTKFLNQNYLKISRKQQVKVCKRFFSLFKIFYTCIYYNNVQYKQIRLLCETLDSIVVMF